MTGQRPPIQGWRSEASAPSVHLSWRSLVALVVSAVVGYSFLLVFAAESIPPWSRTCSQSALEAGAICDTGPLYALVGLGCVVGGLVVSALVRGPEGLAWIVLGVFLGLAPLAVFFEVHSSQTGISGMATAIFLILLPITEIPAILLGYGLGRLLARHRHQLD